MRFYSYHGTHDHEKAQGQVFVVDVEIHLDIKNRVRDDNLETTMDYSKVYRMVKSVVEGERFHLLETVALRIREEIMKGFSPLGVVVRCRKPRVPLEGDIEYVEVEIR